MTCNKLIALLECYRTGRPRESGCGTTTQDLEYLFNRGLITADDQEDQWSITDRGRRKVEALLELMS